MSISLMHPIPGARPTDPFGWRAAIPGVIGAQLHNGQDWAADAGTIIRAAHDGYVAWTGWDYAGGGWLVEVAAPGYATRYAHMRAQSPLSPGQAVEAGQIVGYVGATGAATGPHLHFILRLDPGGPVDPMPYIDTPAASQAPPATAVPPIQQRKRSKKMILIGTKAYMNDKNAPGYRWAVVGSGFFHEIWNKNEANAVARQVGNAFEVSGPRYRAYRASAQQGMK